VFASDEPLIGGYQFIFLLAPHLFPKCVYSDFLQVMQYLITTAEVGSYDTSML